MEIVSLDYLVPCLLFHKVRSAALLPVHHCLARLFSQRSGYLLIVSNTGFNFPGEHIILEVVLHPKNTLICLYIAQNGMSGLAGFSQWQSKCSSSSRCLVVEQHLENTIGNQNWEQQQVQLLHLWAVQSHSHWLLLKRCPFSFSLSCETEVLTVYSHEKSHDSQSVRDWSLKKIDVLSLLSAALTIIFLLNHLSLTAGESHCQD